MRIDLKELQREPQGIARFAMVESMPDTLLGDMGGRFVEAVKVDLEVSFTGEFYVGQGKAQTRLEFACSRCLTPHAFPLVVPLDLIMMEAKTQAPDDLKDDALLVEQGEVDIGPGLMAAIFSVIPLNPLCDPDCRGLCAGCGVNKNLQSCQCSEDDIDPRWGALRKLIREGGE